MIKSETQLTIARRNTFLFLAVVFALEVIWLLISRAFFNLGETHLYNVSPFNLFIVFQFVMWSVLLISASLVSTRISKPLFRISTPRSFFIALLIVCMILNLIMASHLQSGARYQTGGLTGIMGVLDGFRNSINLISFLLYYRERQNGLYVSNILLALVLCSYILAIDGANPAIRMFMAVFLLISLNQSGIRSWYKVGFAAILLGSIGLMQKFSELPNLSEIERLTSWFVARMSIQAEHMYTFLSGDSLIKNVSDYYGLIKHSFNNRVELIFYGEKNFDAPRNVSEALYFDLKQRYGSGSSPGILLSAAFQSISLFWVVPLLFSFFFLQYFYGLNRKINVFEAIAFSFVLKPLYTNVAEYIVLISPAVLALAIFLLGSLLVYKPKPDY